MSFCIRVDVDAGGRVSGVQVSWFEALLARCLGRRFESSDEFVVIVGYVWRGRAYAVDLRERRRAVRSRGMR